MDRTATGRNVTRCNTCATAVYDPGFELMKPVHAFLKRSGCVHSCSLVLHSTATPHCGGDHTRECVRDDCARHCSYAARVRGVRALELPPLPMNTRADPTGGGENEGQRRGCCGLQNNRPKDDKTIPENIFRGRKYIPVALTELPPRVAATWLFVTRASWRTRSSLTASPLVSPRLAAVQATGLFGQESYLRRMHWRLAA